MNERLSCNDPWPVHSAMRGLSADELRVVRLRGDNYSFRDIGVVLISSD